MLIQPDTFDRIKELSCLSTAIYAEARNQSELGQRLVAEVILNRVDSPRFAGTICGVVYQPYQFSFVRDINAQKALEAFTAEVPSKEVLTAIKVAKRAIARPRSERMVGNHYHTVSIKPVWSKKMKPAAVVQDHVFYAE